MQHASNNPGATHPSLSSRYSRRTFPANNPSYEQNLSWLTPGCGLRNKAGFRIFRLCEPPIILRSMGSSKNLVQALLSLFDQLLSWCDDFFGQELEQVVLIGEADGLQYTLLYEEVLKHRPVFAFLLKNRDTGDFYRSTVTVIPGARMGHSDPR